MSYIYLSSEFGISDPGELRACSDTIGPTILTGLSLALDSVPIISASMCRYNHSSKNENQNLYLCSSQSRSDDKKVNGS